jgi:hypothetical protein
MEKEGLIMFRRLIHSPYFISYFFILYLICYAWLLDPAAHAAPQLQVDRPNQRQIMVKLRLENEDIGILELNEAGEVFQQVWIMGFGTAGKDGRPELPFREIPLEIPEGVQVHAHVLGVKWEKIPGVLMIYPRQPLNNLNETPPPFMIDESFY